MEEVDVVRQSLRRRFPLSVVILLTTTFAVLAVVGQVGQNVSLPLWSSATQPCNSQNISSNSSTYMAVMDPYFVLSFASLSFVVIYFRSHHVGNCDCPSEQHYQGRSEVPAVAVFPHRTV